MALWSTKRKFLYGFSVVGMTVLIVAGIFGGILYRAPTCTDGFKNGDEKDVDCGGSCKNLCTSDALMPIILWSKIFNISGSAYTAAAYVENPNINSKNAKAEYEFKIFDTNNKLIVTKKGVTSIPKGKKFAVFEAGLDIKNTIPKFVEFNFTSFSDWEVDTKKEPEISLDYSTLLSTSTSPRINGVVKNDSGEDIKKVELVVMVLDNKDNVVATSRSFVDNLSKRSSQDFVFTWPKPFNLGIESCTLPLDIVVALDKSGSMRSEGLSPPEPFTTVISTAQNFIKNLKSEDNVSVVTFGNSSTLESILFNEKQTVVSNVGGIYLSTTTVEQTNITMGLETSLLELESSRARSNSKKAIILLTDGIPTLPLRAGVANNPTVSAQAVAKTIKEKNIQIYTIGLGKNVSDDFLKSISFDEGHYFFAPDKNTLTSIYSKISSNLCEKKPNVITVIYRII